MKVAVIAHIRHPIREPFAGGLEAHTHGLVSQLQARGHQVTLFATPQSDPALPVEPLHTDVLDLDCNLLPHAKQTEDWLHFHQEHHSYQRLMLELQHADFDIVHNNSLHYLPISMASLLPMPVVTVLHTPPFPWLQGAAVLECASRKIHYVLPSHALGKRWAPYLWQYEVIHNGVDTGRWRFSPEAKSYVAWSGRLVPEKGVHYAIQAAQLAGIPLYFAGPVSNREYFEREIAPKLGGDIRYLGHLDHENVRRFISHARAFLATPCWDEPFGLNVAEAMACGTPIIAFDRGAMAELIGTQGGITIPFPDAAAMAAAIKESHRLPRIQVRRRAETYFSQHAMIDAYERIYRRLAKNTAAPQELKIVAAAAP